MVVLSTLALAASGATEAIGLLRHHGGHEEEEAQCLRRSVERWNTYVREVEERILADHNESTAVVGAFGTCRRCGGCRILVQTHPGLLHTRTAPTPGS